MASIRPRDPGAAPAPPALARWPKAPKGYSPAEIAAWDEIGEAVLVLRTVSTADLLMVGRAAQVRARASEMFADGDIDPGRLASMLRLEANLYKELGLSPQARRAVSPLVAKKGKAEAEADPLSEF